MPALEEAPVTETAPTPEPLGKISDAYDKALKDVENKAKVGVTAPAKEGTKKEVVKSKDESKPDPAPDASAEEAEKAPVKPASALDAVIEKKVDEAKKPDEQKAEVPVDELPTNTPAAPLRAALKRREQEIQKLRTELEKASAGDPATKGQLEVFQKERDALKAENDKLRDAITKVNVDYDPQVQEKFVVGKSKIIDKATKAVEQYGGDAKAFGEAMQLTGKRRTDALREALANVDEMDRPAIYAKLEKVRELEEEHADLLANSHQSYEKLTQQQQERAQQQQAEAARAKAEIASRALSTLPQKHPLFREAPTETEGAQDYNSRLKADMQKAEYLRGPEANWEEISAASAKAARYDFLEEVHLEYRQNASAEIAQLKEQLAKFESAEPGFSGSKRPGGQSKLDKSPAEIYNETMAAMSVKEV